MDVLISMLIRRYDAIHPSSKQFFQNNNYFKSLIQEISLVPGRYTSIQLIMIIDILIEATKLDKQLYLNYRVIINVFDPDLKVEKVQNWFYFSELKNRINKQILDGFIPNIETKLNSELSLYVFSLQSLPLDVLTSYDGRRIYINSEIKNPLNDNQIKLLEKALVHALYRLDNLDPLRIIEMSEPKLNRNGELMDIGEYYLSKAYPSGRQQFPWSFIVHRYKKMI